VFISGVHIFSENPAAISKYLVPEGGQKTSSTPRETNVRQPT